MIANTTISQRRWAKGYTGGRLFLLNGKDWTAIFSVLIDDEWDGNTSNFWEDRIKTTHDAD